MDWEGGAFLSLIAKDSLNANGLGMGVEKQCQGVSQQSAYF